MLQDLRYGARTLFKQPGFTLLAALTLTLGIGASTAIFSVVNAVLLRPLPYRDADRLVMLSTDDHAGVLGNIGYATFADWRERSQSFERMAAIRLWGGTLTGQGEPEVIDGMRVSANYFTLLGVRPLLGRNFEAEDDRPATRFVAIISDALWQRRFKADPNVLGRTLSVSDQPYTIVGVMPPHFTDLSAKFFEAAEVWAPLGYEVTQPTACRDCQHLKAFARLQPGVSLAQASTEMRTIMEVMQADHPTSYSTPAIHLSRLQDQLVGAMRPALYLLLAAVFAVLAMACANVANLLLVRASARSREMALRAALGAGYWRIARQLLVEGSLLALLGAGGGLLVALWGTELLIRLSPAKLLPLSTVTLDGRVLGFTLVLSLATGLLFSLVPLWPAMRQDAQRALKEDARTTSSRGQRQVRQLIVTAEIAFAVTLLAGAGVLVRSFALVLRVTPGFDSRNVLTMEVPTLSAKYRETSQKRAFNSEAMRRIQGLPGVDSVGIVSNLPFAGNRDMSGFHVEQKPLLNPADAPNSERYGISPGYLATMGIPVLAGRGFSDLDGPNATLVALINHTAAVRIWPNQDPLGKRIRLGDIDSPLRVIVGVVGDVNHYGLETAPDLQAYVPHAQWTDSSMQFVVRTSADPSLLSGPVREAIHAIDSDMPVQNMTTLRQLLSASVAPRRFTLSLMTVFAVLAMTLAALGIYGVLACAVIQRTREIGIRIALGARASDVRRLVLRQGLTMVLLGIVIGLATALGATRLMQRMLFGVSATDPLTFAVTTLVLMSVALLACWVPVRRAAHVDPMIALR